MNQQKEDSILARLGLGLRQFPRTIRDGWRHDIVAFRNWIRRLRDRRLDYVVIPVSGSLPERSGPPRSFLQRQLPLPPAPLAMETLNRRAQAIADAQNVTGVVFVLQEFAAPGLARLQSLRRTIERLRVADKKTVVYTPHLDLAHFYVACAAERIVAPPGTQFEVLGLHMEALFLREALEQIGIEPEVLQISPYKTAFNLFEKSEITEEQHQQLSWLLDDNYELISAEMAQGRASTPAAIQSLIDRAPFSVETALDEGLIDDVAYEDELPSLLAPARPETTEHNEPEEERPQAKLLSWQRARNVLLEKARRPTEKYIGVVSLEGAITMGPSRQPPIDIPIPFIGGAMAGEETISQLLRRAEKSEKMAALILHVDSGGGSALASDLIWRQVKRLAQKKPVLAYMGNVAASGGYYVLAGAQHVMSQPATLTGSIGVIIGRFNAQDLYRRLGIGRASLQRGRHAGLYREVRPLTEEERNLLWRSLVDTYDRFKEIVVEGRNLSADEVEPVAGGRVWTGRQALQHRLVDSHGDFVDAVRKAAMLAELPIDDDHDIQTRNFYPKTRPYLTPEPYEAGQMLVDLLSAERLQALGNGPLAMLPFELRIR
ncbi:MAG TPA: signal peptide peptidase SppA [Candidatus Sulfomarinibacteraceae bacterium]|nr:signal peptide peptidase SppA [Candidatus Sulfomarinibacteraceae bacterium]